MRCGEIPQFRGCPRNCKRRILRHMPLGISVLGRRRRVTTRKPGDLPSAVVTREDVGRGVQALASPELLSAQWWDLVRCDVPLTSYRGLNHVFHHRRAGGAAVLLASSFLAPLVSLGISGAQAQQTASTEQLPPIEVSPPGDQNRTRAKPTYDEGSGRAASRLIPHRPTAPESRAGTGANVASQGDGQGGGGNLVQGFSGIVGTASTVITAQEIAHSPAQTLQEIIAQAPGVQLTSLFGGVNGVKTSVDLRGFGAFATSNTLVLINGRRLNDIDMAGVDFSTIPRNSIERIEIIRGNSGAVLYGDNAIGGVINIVLKNGVGGPPVAIRGEAGVGSFNQRMASVSAATEFRPVVDIVLRQRHQVRRLPRQQRPRPAQRGRQHQLHHARPDRVPDSDRRRPEARTSRRPYGRSLDRRQRTGHGPPRRCHAVRLR